MRPDVGHLPFREYVAEDVAGVHKTDQGDVPRVGHIIGQQHVLHAQLDLAFDAPVDGGIAPGTENPQELLVLGLENAAFDEAVHGLLADVGGLLPGQHFHPLLGIHGVGGTGHALQGPVQERVVRGCRVDHQKSLGVGVDAVGEGQVHQYGAYQDVLYGAAANRQEQTVVVQHQQYDFFSECDHGAA